MTAVHVLLVVLLGQAPKADPEALVQRLGAARFADREAAAQALEQLGAEALPALRAARDDKDLEIRTRSATLLAKIESAALLKPTMVRLDVQDRPLRDVIRDLNDQTHLKISAFPENQPAWSKRITLHEPEPVPFWKAVDLLCAKGQIQLNISNSGFPGSAEPVIRFFSGSAAIIPPAHYEGVFKVMLTGIQLHQNLMLTQGEKGMTARVVNNHFGVDLSVAVEPRLVAGSRGAVKLSEAVDERGQSYLPNGSGPTGLGAMSGAFSQIGVGQSALGIPVPLKRPEQPGRTLHRLRGTIPLWVAARRPEPLVIPLADARGKSFTSGNTTIEVHDIKAQPNGQTTIELTVRESGDPILNPPQAVAVMMPMMGRGMGQARGQIEVLDDAGKAISWFPTQGVNAGSPSRMTLLTQPQPVFAPGGMNPPAAGPPAGPKPVDVKKAVREKPRGPALLRFYEMVHATADVSFDFRDIPLP